LRTRRFAFAFIAANVMPVISLNQRCPGLPLAASLALLLLGAAQASGGSPSRYEAFRRGAYLPYLNAPAPDGDIARVPRLRISFGARSYDVVMDTGSTGVVVSADKIPNIDRLQSLGRGELTYSSSGRVMIGQWVVTPMTIAGAGGARVTTAPIPVLAVTRIECTPQARRCTPNDAPRGVSMLGIGFARRGDHQAQSGPDRNPFLNVARLDGDGPNPTPLRRGYIVTRRGVHVGLTGANTEGDFAYVKLARAADDRDWAATPVCIAVNGATPAACGTVLVDTGVTTMYLTVPESQAPDAIVVPNGRGVTLTDGTKVAISIPTADAPQASYQFAVGDRINPLAPQNLVLVSRTRAPFVNTSLRFLNGFDYLFDADGGFAGFRWTGRAAQGVGKVVPAPPTD
jgi:hypothetical protein